MKMAAPACPAFDLIPEDGEDAFVTLRSLPLTYIMIGFTRTNVGAPRKNPGRGRMARICSGCQIWPTRPTGMANGAASSPGSPRF